MCKLIWLLPVLLLSGCGERSEPAPVEEVRWRAANYNQSYHVVRKGETLYSLAFRYDSDYRQLAVYNHLNDPYHLRVGQIIRLHPQTSRGQIRSRPTYHAHPKSQPSRTWIPSSNHPPKKITAPVFSSASSGFGRWRWPAQGRVIGFFQPQAGKKGIDIAGKKGTKVQAAADGIVAYAGNGLSGYGNLIIIKHDGQFLTAYANNAHNQVNEGQKVKAGQIIAEMGLIDRKYWGVHFEIRKSGQPVNPLNYLKK